MSLFLLFRSTYFFNITHRNACFTIPTKPPKSPFPLSYQRAFSISISQKTKTLSLSLTTGFLFALALISIWRCPTLTWGNPTLPSALLRFTSEFGMESGRATALWSPEYSVDDFGYRLRLYLSFSLFFICFLFAL